MKKVTIGGISYTLADTALIGSGGEGSVYRLKLPRGDVAVKVYHKPTTERGAKVRDFLSHRWALPTDRIALPLEAVCDSGGNKIIGLTMPYLGSGFEELATFANRKFRATHGITNKQVTSVLLDGAVQVISPAHALGIVMGDLNERNGLYRGNKMLFIDADSYQFGSHPCPVATEMYLCPDLYNMNLEAKPSFLPVHDWYAFAVLLYRSLLLVHPYGGTHPQLMKITDRALRKVTILDSGVTVPSFAMKPEVLDTAMLDVFDQFFTKGIRKVFPIDTLRNFSDHLRECKKCGSWVPDSRAMCPVCQVRQQIVTHTVLKKDITFRDILTSTGDIVLVRIMGGQLYVLTHERGVTVLYTGDPLQGRLLRQELFPIPPKVTYGLFENTLVVSQDADTALRLYDLGARSWAADVTTSRFAITRRLMFRTDASALYRISAGRLLRGQYRGQHYLETTVRQVMEEHTWFTADPSSVDPRLVGFFQMPSSQIWWLSWEGSTYDNLALGQMDDTEVFVDLSVKFDRHGVLIRRKIERNGISGIRYDQVSSKGVVAYSSPWQQMTDQVVDELHGQVYQGGILLHATDAGVVQDRIESGDRKTFEKTKGLLHEGDSLMLWGRGLLITSGNRLGYVELGQLS